MPGFKLKTTQAFVPYIDSFVEFLKDCKMLDKIKEYQESLQQNSNVEGTLTNHNIVITGFRDKKIIENIEKQGGKLLNAVNKNTHLVVVKDINNESTKTMKAKKLGITIMNLKTFQEQYAI